VRDVNLTVTAGEVHERRDEESVRSADHRERRLVQSIEIPGGGWRRCRGIPREFEVAQLNVFRTVSVGLLHHDIEGARIHTSQSSVQSIPAARVELDAE
jgi:hypothetical protein